MNSLLEVNKISYTYPGNKEETLKDISFTLKPGELLAILGPNGGGKSTLLKVLIREYLPSSGTLSCPLKLSEMGYLPQRRSLCTDIPLSVFQVLHLGLHKLKNEECQHYLKRLGLEKKKDALFSTLSPGESQRVLLLRELIKDPKLLILDEPNTGVDQNGQDEFYSILLELRKEKNIGMIIVEHNIGEVIKKSDSLLCLNRTTHWHNQSELLRESTLEDIYGCEFKHLLFHHNKGEHNGCS